MEMTLLSMHQIWGDKNGRGQLEVMKRCGTETGISDLAILLGAEMGDSTVTYDGQRSGNVWTASHDERGRIYYIRHDDCRMFNSCCSSTERNSVRPILLGLPSHKPRLVEHGIGTLGLSVVEYGEYPQKVVSAKIASKLDQAISENALRTTGKNYMFNVIDKNLTLNLEPHKEYQYKGRKYVRVKAQLINKYSIMSNETIPQEGEYYWVKVEPVEWLVEPHLIWRDGRMQKSPAAGTWVAKNALLAGLPMIEQVWRDLDSDKATPKKQWRKTIDYDGDFKSTTLYNYLQEHLLKEIQPSRTLPKLEGSAYIKSRESLHPTNKVSEISKVPVATRPDLSKLLYRIYGTFYQEELAMSVHQLLGAPKDNPYSKEALAAWQTGESMPSAEEFEAITELTEAAIPPARRRVWDAMKKNLQACYDAVIANPEGEAAKVDWKTQLGVVWKEWDGTAAGNDIKAQLLSNYFGRIDPERPNLEFLMLEYNAGRLRVNDKVCQAIEDATATEDGHKNIIPGINVREAMKLPNPEPEQPLSKPEKKKPGFLGIPTITLPFGKSVTER